MLLAFPDFYRNHGCISFLLLQVFMAVVDEPASHLVLELAHMVAALVVQLEIRRVLKLKLELIELPSLVHLTNWRGVLLDCRVTLVGD